MPNPADTLTLDDLKKWDRGDNVSLAVLGCPVAHSVSPQMHNAALAELSAKYPQLQEWRYFKFEIKPEELEQALGLLKGKNFKGVNLTVPHKTAPVVLTHLDREFRRYGAGNTLFFYPEGLLVTNSDGYGLTQSLRRDLKVNLRDALEVVVLGVGGAARAAVIACLNEGCGKVWVGNRTLEKLHSFVEMMNRARPLSNHHAMEGFSLAVPPAKQWSDNVVIINATTVGMKPGDFALLDVSLLGKQATVLDMVYRREGLTPLVSAAQARGLRAVDGLGMLIWQGAFSLQSWLSAFAQVKVTAEELAPTMMNAACAALGLPRRHV